MGMISRLGASAVSPLGLAAFMPLPMPDGPDAAYRGRGNFSVSALIASIPDPFIIFGIGEERAKQRVVQRVA
jgi:hypothetical protein